ncbi:MAG: LptF/LptG family permease, partial [Planctomycetaceae bacterium]|nr:LptF/LptG family permease [Planctomycetaceae bacterium]
MTKIDRYILRKFLFNFVLWMFCLFGIVVVFDMFTNADTLLKAGERAGNLPKILAMFYFFKLVPMSNIISALLVLVAAMITIATMMRNNELVPIQAAGITSARIIRPIVIAAIIMTLISTVAREIILPRYINKITDNPFDYVEDTGKIMSATIDQRTGIMFQGDKIFLETRQISEPSFVLATPLVDQPIHIDAKNAYYQAANADHPAGFLIDDIQNMNERLKGSSLTLIDEPIVITYNDAEEWLQPSQCFIVSDVPFMYLTASRNWETYASTWDLLKAVRNPSLDVGARLQSRVHARLLLPLLDMTLLFLGLPLIFVQGDRNVFRAVGMSSLLVVAFIVVKESCQFIGANSGMPVLGAWLPVMI